MQRSTIAYSICRHLSENGYQWPRSWDDLKPSFDAEIGNESPWDYETLKSTVSLSFDIDGEELVVSCRDPGYDDLDAIQFENKQLDPNQHIVEYVRLMTQDRE